MWFDACRFRSSMKHEPIDALFMSIPKDYSSMRCSAGKDPVPRAQCEHEAVRLFHYEVLDMPSIMFQVPRIVVLRSGIPFKS